MVTLDDKRKYKIATQADLDEYREFQRWFNSILEDSINDTIYEIKEGTETMQNGNNKTEMLKFIQTQLMKQTEFSLTMFKQYKEKKANR